MACWIATHNPHTLSGVPHHIYFKKPRKTVPSAGESVFIYETESPEKGQTEPGRGAIIFLAKASGKVVQNPHANRDEWPLKMDCYDHTPIPFRLRMPGSWSNSRSIGRRSLGYPRRNAKS